MKNLLYLLFALPFLATAQGDLIKAGGVKKNTQPDSTMYFEIRNTGSGATGLLFTNTHDNDSALIYLDTTGTLVVPGAGGASPAGNNTEIQVNVGGSFGSYPNFRIVDSGMGYQDVFLDHASGSINSARYGIFESGDYTYLRRLTGGSSYDLFFPNAQGGINETLINDGSGSLSWGLPSSSISIGDAVGGSANNKILFVDGAGALSQSNDFEFTEAMANFPVLSVLGSSGGNINSSSITLWTGPTYSFNMQFEGGSSSSIVWPAAYGSSGDVLTTNGAGVLSWSTPAGGSSVFSDLTSATGTNAIDNTTYLQSWQWNGLAGTGLQLYSNSTAAAGDAQMMVDIYLQGANANAGEMTAGIVSRNQHTGTGSINVAGYFTSSGGDANYAILVPSSGGNVGIGLVNPSATLDVAGTLQFATGNEGANKVLVSDAGGNADWGNIIDDGTYTPTLTNVTNLDASTAYTCQYSRNGNVVTVSGKFSADPTTGAASTELGFTLPIASNLAADEEVGGAGLSILTSPPAFAAPVADAANDRVKFVWMPSHTTNAAYTFSFTYLIN